MLARNGRTRSRTVNVSAPLERAEAPPPAPVVPESPSTQHTGTVNSLNTSESAQPIHRGLALHDSLVYSRSSTFSSKTGRCTLTIRSPGARTEQRGPFQTVEIPIFGLRDVIGGSVSVRAPPGVGTLVITMEGALYYSSPSFARKFATQVSNPLRHKHVFLSSTFLFLPGSSTYSTSTSAASTSNLNPRVVSQSSSFGSVLKRALSTSKRKEAPAETPTARPRAEVPPTQNITRSFSFQIPTRVDQEIPPSFYASVLNDGSRDDPVRERASVESAEVEYRISAVWESSTGRRTSAETPFLFLPDPSYATPRRPLQWSESPLVATRPLPFKCALSLPHPRTFARGPDGSIPFHVTFATDPPSRSLARDIASEAVIQVALARSLSLEPSRGIRTNFSTAPSSSATATSGSTTTTTTTNTSSKRSTGGSMFSGLKRVATVPSRKPPREEVIVAAEPEEEPPVRTREKPLPAPPPEASVQDISVLQTVKLNGFTPAASGSRSKKHAKEGSVSGPGILFTPDGSCKGRLDLSREALPTIRYGGANVKYVVTASVRFGSEELRTAVDIKIVEPVARWERDETIRHGPAPAVFS